VQAAQKSRASKSYGLKIKLSLIPTPHLNKKKYVTSFSFFGTRLSFFLDSSSPPFWT
jgi:hypothetical protein